ncbi:hypothetical protein RND71_025602 [Anisodus tanguticus]|uniref:Uncharacterized protein n=1 Tax=Anisodus tanguticus TaxID=243964 RepID=A0AAE1RT95_9SOLA|nr:hypothetical protein RND71_025602 [Anisodus tanguticus]
MGLKGSKGIQSELPARHNIFSDIHWVHVGNSPKKEYERRVKNSRKLGGEEEIQIFSYFSSILAQKFNGYSSKIKMRLGETKIGELMMIKGGVFEPESEVGLAAINGFFSA